MAAKKKNAAPQAQAKGSRVPEAKTRRAALGDVASAFKGLRPARETMTMVRAVPTRFVQLDHATGVGGWPIERFSLVHGPSNEGKTTMMLGLADSFLGLGHYALLEDAERTTPKDWVQKLLRDNFDSERFFYNRPDSYEEARENVRAFCNGVLSVGAGKVSGLVVLDSLKALTPEDFFTKVTKDDPKAGMDGAGNRGGQILAKYNSAWMRELVILLDQTKCGMVAIGREMEDPNADPWAVKTGTNYKIGGGRDVYYDASLAVRVERHSWITHGEGKERKVYGERHKLTIRKTKVAGKEDKVVIAYFHTSNGVLIPAGFDRARDVLDLGLRFGVIKQSGSSYSFNGTRIANGLDNAVVVLTDDEGWLQEIEAKVREGFTTNAAVEEDLPVEAVSFPSAAAPGKPRGPRQPKPEES